MTVYTNTARFDNTARALTEDELFRLAPSIFATEAHSSRSERFKPIATIEVVRGLAKEGFAVVGAQQSVTRLPDRKNFTRHQLRLRRLDDTKYQVGDTVAEMLLKNANDGTAAYDLMSGLFRIRCLNSMVAKVGELSSCKVRHSGDAVNKVIEGTFAVIDESRKALAAPEKWSGLQLRGEEKVALAKAADVLRFGEEEPDDALMNTDRHQQLLNPRRWDDRASDLWTTFNVVQENVIRGGIERYRYDANGIVRRGKSREVKGIDQSNALNKALFVLANEMAKIHGVAIN